MRGGADYNPCGMNSFLLDLHAKPMIRCKHIGRVASVTRPVDRIGGFDSCVHYFAHTASPPSR
jgi:hypothetical protein